MNAQAWEVGNLDPNPKIDFTKDCIVWDAHRGDDRRLLVSNAPETVTNLNTPVLWHDKVIGKKDQTSVKHRVFIWHTNGMRKIPIRIGVTIENFSNQHALRLTDCRGIAVSGSSYDCLNEVGIPLVKSALDIRKATDITPADPRIGQAGSSDPAYLRGVNGWDIEPKQMLGALIEFTVSKENEADEGNLYYMVRVVAGKAYTSMTGNARLREGADGKGLAPLESKQVIDEKTTTHSRGSWPFSTIAINNKAHPYLYSAEPRYAFITFLDAKDLLMTRGNSYDSKNASPEGNAGNWGVTYHMEVHVALPAEIKQKKNVELRFIGIDTSPWPGAKAYAYAGACRIGDESANLIPIMKWGTEKDCTNVVWTFQPEPEKPASQVFEIMHAGGACLPVGIRLKGVGDG